MKVAIVGGHGNIAMLLHPLLRQNGHEVRGLIRNPDQADDLRAAGAEPVVCDVEKEADISGAVGDADAVVFAAGGGPTSGEARKWTVDRDGALKLIDAARENGIRRYLMISAMGSKAPRGEGVFRVYLEAKAEADQALRESDLDYTILRPGRLTDEPGSGRVAIAADLPRGEIPRADVAAVLAHLLETPASARREFDLVSGDRKIPEAVAAAIAGGRSG
ncbi:MAG: SDR family oxidoreductase [Gemmatimonadota bacterium]